MPGGNEPRKLKIGKHTKADLIRNVVAVHPEWTCAEAGAFYGDEDLFTSSHYSTIKKETIAAMAEEAAPEPSKKKKLTAKKTKPDTPPPEVAKLRNENAYLRWLLKGEREGFLNRWLEESDA